MECWHSWHVMTHFPVGRALYLMRPRWEEDQRYCWCHYWGHDHRLHTSAPKWASYWLLKLVCQLDSVKEVCTTSNPFSSHFICIGDAGRDQTKRWHPITTLLRWSMTDAMYVGLPTLHCFRVRRSCLHAGVQRLWYNYCTIFDTSLLPSLSSPSLAKHDRAPRWRLPKLRRMIRLRVAFEAGAQFLKLEM